MDEYAVIQIKDKQFRVTKGDEIMIPGVYVEKQIPQVLLLVKKGNISLGKPFLDKVFPKVEIIEGKVKGKKVEVFKYKAKSRYRKKIGFRSVFTKLRINDLG